MPADRHRHTADEENRIREAALDHTIEDSFPASDPLSSIPNPDDDELVAQGPLTMPATHALRLNRILLAIDLAAPGESAIVQAHWWAQQFGAALDIVYVVDEGHAGDAATASESDERLQAARRNLSELVERLAPDAERRRHVMVRPGRAAATIASVAASADTALIVMGSHGRTLVGRWMLGSVAAEVLRDAVIPVLIVKEPAGSSLDHATVVVGVDFSDASEAALTYAGQLAADCGASLCLIHVLPIGEHHSAGHAVMREAALKALQELQERHVPSTVNCHHHVEMGMGAPAHAIAHYAASEGARLIVMGGHGGSGWTAGVLGSVTNRVIHETSIPALVVRPVRAVSS